MEQKAHVKEKEEDRLPVHDSQAEWFLLACVVNKPELIGAINLEAIYQSDARAMGQRMKALILAGHSSVQRAETFEHQLMLETLDRDVFGNLNRALNELPSAHDWDYWLGIVTNFHQSRTIRALGSQLEEAAEGIRGGDSLGALRLAGELKSLASGGQTAEGRTMQELGPELIAGWEEHWNKGGGLKGVSTGFTNLDRITSGLQDNRLYVIAGRPAQGKSSFCLQLAHHASAAGVRTVFYSLEMPNLELAGRLAAEQGRFDAGAFSRGTAVETDFQKATIAIRQTHKLPLVFVDHLCSLSDLVASAHRHYEAGARLLIFDYLQRIRIPNFKGTRNDLVTEISLTLKDLAMSLKIPVVAAAQLNRGSEKEGRRPSLADLRDSGSIEQDADFVGLLHSEGGQSEESLLLVGKNRSGDTGVLSFTFRRQFTRFDCL